MSAPVVKSTLVAPQLPSDPSQPMVPVSSNISQPVVQQGNMPQTGLPLQNLVPMTSNQPMVQPNNPIGQMAMVGQMSINQAGMMNTNQGNQTGLPPGPASNQTVTHVNQGITNLQNPLPMMSPQIPHVQSGMQIVANSGMNQSGGVQGPNQNPTLTQLTQQTTQQVPQIGSVTSQVNLSPVQSSPSAKPPMPTINSQVDIAEAKPINHEQGKPKADLVPTTNGTDIMKKAAELLIPEPSVHESTLNNALIGDIKPLSELATPEVKPQSVDPEPSKPAAAESLSSEIWSKLEAEVTKATDAVEAAARAKVAALAAAAAEGATALVGATVPVSASASTQPVTSSVAKAPHAAPVPAAASPAIATSTTVSTSATSSVSSVATAAIATSTTLSTTAANIAAGAVATTVASTSATTTAYSASVPSITTSTTSDKSSSTSFDKSLPKADKSPLSNDSLPKASNKRKRENKPPSEDDDNDDGGDEEGESSEERKPRRARTRTQPYQVPLSSTELGFPSRGKRARSPEEKLIVFYKNEFLAVRNAEGGFYVCQSMQNVYRRSQKIRIRWLSQDESGEAGASSKDEGDVYSPDFYDLTDFDCILTNLNLVKLDKAKFRLPPDELARTESILKRALDVEKGSAKPAITEEHPDGLDLSLFKDQSQLKAAKRSAKNDTDSDSSDSESESESDDSSDSDKKKDLQRRTRGTQEPRAQTSKTAKRKATSNVETPAKRQKVASQSVAKGKPKAAEKPKPKSQKPALAKKSTPLAKSPELTTRRMSRSQASLLAKMETKSATRKKPGKKA